MSNFHPFEGGGRGSETQLQVGENLNYSLLQWQEVPPAHGDSSPQQTTPDP